MRGGQISRVFVIVPARTNDGAMVVKLLVEP